jgi:hypothetical protein
MSKFSVLGVRPINKLFALPSTSISRRSRRGQARAMTEAFGSASSGCSAVPDLSGREKASMAGPKQLVLS